MKRNHGREQALRRRALYRVPHRFRFFSLLDLSANTVFIAGAFRRALDGIRMREYWDIWRNPSLPPGIAFVVRCISPDVAGREWNWLMPFQQRDLTSDVRQVFLDRLQL